MILADELDHTPRRDGKPPVVNKAVHNISYIAMVLITILDISTNLAHNHQHQIAMRNYSTTQELAHAKSTDTSNIHDAQIPFN